MPLETGSRSERHQAAILICRVPGPVRSVGTVMLGVSVLLHPSDEILLRESDLAATVCVDPAGDEDLRKGWRRLAEERGNPFVTPEWFDAWREVGGPASVPRVVAVRRGNQLIGVMPMTLERGRPCRRLRFAGGEMGDCFHPVSREADEVAVAVAAGRVLRGREWGSIELRNGLAGTEWRERLIEAAGAAGARHSLRPQVLPYADFAGLGWDAFLASRSRSFRQGARRLMRRLRERGEVSFRFSDEATLDADLRRFFELHDMRWGRGSTFLNERSVRFHTAFARTTLEWGWLRLGNLELDGHTIAATYGWRLGNRFSEFQRGYDMELAKLGPGKLVMVEMMRSLNEEGVEIYDQLVGDEDYKQQTSAGSRTVGTIQAARPRTPGSIAIRTERLARDLYAKVPEERRAALRTRRRGGGGPSAS